MIYFSLVVISLITIVFDFLRNDLLFKKAVFFSLVSFFVLFAGLREVGKTDGDSINYFSIYNTVSSSSVYELTFSNSTGIEPGYLLINKLFSQFGFNYEVFQLFIALASLLPLMILVYRISPLPFFSLFLYISSFYFLRDFTQIRNSLSCTFLLWFFFYDYQKKSFLAISLLIVAVSIHNASWIGVVYLLFKVLVKKKLFYIILPLLGIFISLLDPVRIIAGYLALPEQIVKYISGDNPMGGVTSTSLILGYIFMLFAFKFNVLENDVSEFNLFYSFFVIISISVFWGLSFLSFSILQRCSLSLFTVSIFFMPMLMDKLALQYKNAAVILFLFVIVFYTYYGYRAVFNGQFGNTF